MAIVLRFDPAMRASAPRGGAQKGPAEILFFTGVRYERRIEASDKRPTRKKRGKMKMAVGQNGIGPRNGE